MLRSFGGEEESGLSVAVGTTVGLAGLSEVLDIVSFVESD